MFIEVKTDPYSESRTTSVNTDNIDYIEELNMRVFTEWKSRIVFKDGNKLDTLMYKYQILSMIRKQ